MNNNPIYIVDDDQDDEDIIRDAINELGLVNELQFFHTAEELINQLKQEKIVPFIIISDINLPKMDGFELREKIINDISISDKTIPFIFWSTTASDTQIKKAYNLSAHGFFLKGRTYKDIKDGMEEIVRYWSRSLAPQ
ncbi:MAG TPA: response regulator [Flavitalea sp.]|nr:response regulator [Flavitalea sp.]